MHRLHLLARSRSRQPQPLHHRTPALNSSAVHYYSTSRSSRFNSSSNSNRPPKNSSSSTSTEETSASAPAPASTPTGSSSKGSNGGATAKAAKVTPAASEEGSTSTSTSSSSSGRRRAARKMLNSISASATASQLQPTVAPAAAAAAAWKPPFVPLPFLSAPPAQITQDAFYALHRPLLEVSLSPRQRRSSSDSQGPRYMEIVGQPAAEEETWTEEQQQQQGEWDAYLVTEPEGPDPAWTEGTEHYLAGLVHNVPPPVPVPASEEKAAAKQAATKRRGAKRQAAKEAAETGVSSAGAEASPEGEGSSIQPEQKQKKKQTASELRRANIDYLFPIQAAQRASDASARLLAESSSLTSPARMPESQLRPYRPSTTPFEASTTSGDLSSHTRGLRFLHSHLLKKTWAALWDWDRVARALAAAIGRAEHRAALSSRKKLKLVESSAAKGEPAAAPPAGEETLARAVRAERTRMTSAATVKASAGPQLVQSKPAAETVSVPSTITTITTTGEQQRPSPAAPTLSRTLDKLSVASRKTHARSRSRSSSSSSIGMVERMTRALEASGARVAVFAINEAGQPRRIDSNGLEAEEGKGPETEEGKRVRDELGRVVDEVRKFQGFFDKSIQLDLQQQQQEDADQLAGAGAGAGAAALRRLEERFGPSPSGGISLEVEFAPSSLREVSSAEELEWASSAPSSSFSRGLALGPRLSQSTRGRSLRPTLSDRLALRGVEMQESEEGINHDRMGWTMWTDSVKRKRRKRISKHKYKKRRKANRAERRRTGK